MIFKETDRTTIGETHWTAKYIKDQVNDFRDEQSDNHNEVTAKLDSITNSIDALADKIDMLTKATVGTADVLQDLGNVMRAIRNLSRVDGEVNKKQFEAIIVGVELITNMLESKKAASLCDEVVDDIPVIRVVKSRRRRFATVHNRYRAHR